MTKNTLIRMSGWALMLGGSLFVWGVIDTGLQDMRIYRILGPYRVYDASAFWGIFIVGPQLIALSMLGLRARYGKGMGGLGRACLLIGTIVGLGATPLAFLLRTLFPDGVVDEGDTFIGAFLLGITLMHASLVLFGVLAIRRRPLSRWNALPVIAGVWMPVSLLIDAVMGSGLGDGVEPIGLITAPAIAIAFILLGNALQADSSEPLRLPSPDPSQPHRRACPAQEIGPHFDLLRSQA